MKYDRRDVFTGCPIKKVVHFVLRGIESPNGSYMLAFIYICSFAGKQVCIKITVLELSVKKMKTGI